MVGIVQREPRARGEEGAHLLHSLNNDPSLRLHYGLHVTVQVFCFYEFRDHGVTHGSWRYECDGGEIYGRGLHAGASLLIKLSREGEEV